MAQPKIQVARPVLDGNEARYVSDCLESNWISSVGQYIGRFEAAFADYCGVKHAVSCCNGTSALHLALLALGVEEGDEVLVPSLTFVATANAVRYCGATPVFVDSDPTTLNIDPSKIETAVTARTKGVIAVHLYGHPADMDAILAVARRRGLFVVEDAAEAHGARYKGTRVGGLADAATFSFFGNKIITTGEGGMITTNDDSSARRMRLLRGQGMDPDRRYWFPMVGYNYRMTNIEAAIGLAQLERIEFHLRKRREAAGWYQEALEPFRDVMRAPAQAAWADHVFWSYPIMLSEKLPISQAELMSVLAEDGIETRPVFIPLHLMPPYRRSGERHPIAEAAASRGISLPMHGALTRDDVRFIVERLAVHCSADEPARASA